MAFSAWSRRLVLAALVLAALACGKPETKRFGTGGNYAYPVVPTGGAVGDLCSVDGGTSPAVCNLAHGNLGANSLVYKPGGVPSSNTYVTWPSLMAAYALILGPTRIFIDDRLAAAHMTAGAWDFGQDVELVGAWGGVGNELIVDQGATWTAKRLRVDALWFHNASTVTPCVVTTPLEILIDHGSTLDSATAAPMVDDTNGNLDIYVRAWSDIGDGTHHAIQSEALVSAKTFIEAFDRAQLLAHALSGTGFLEVDRDSSTSYAVQDAVNASSVLISTAPQVVYAPGVTANWNPAPSLVSGALDQLAAPNIFGQTSTIPGASASPFTFTPAGNITKVRSGKVVVSASAAGTATIGSNSTITLSLLRDSTQIAADQVHEQTNGDVFGVSVDVIDALPDTAAHTYSFTLTNSGGGTFTGLTNGATLWVHEL